MPPSDYQPRSPAHGVLYQVVREHYETFRAQAQRASDGAGLPRFVQEEFEGFLRYPLPGGDGDRRQRSRQLVCGAGSQRGQRCQPLGARGALARAT
jgi:hypothetical protein